MRSARHSRVAVTALLVVVVSAVVALTAGLLAARSRPERCDVIQLAVGAVVPFHPYVFPPGL
jgi:hypothetical protein